ncbi:hypothetical protein [Brevibacillus brevis]|uniref:hypothetical protein n=1 Tax=Brevibacillus brevis TaxID=1393 RepID=UPI001C8EC900|nr:hypothetical protein [Brevibacillus brevis]MBY0088404.1 hypothetical protein [Brevibacillus brevis]
MIFVLFDLVTEEKGLVTLRNFDPSTIPSDLAEKGLFVESIPAAEPLRGKNAILFINPKTQKLWYEYVDKPITEEDDLTVIRSHVLQQSEALTNAHDAIAYQSEEILNLRSEIEALKGGQA